MNIVVGYWKDDHDSDNVLKLAAHHSKVFNAKVYVITSLKGGWGEKMEEINYAEKNLSYAMKYLKELGIEAEQRLLVRGLTPGEDIVQFAEDNKSEEVIVGVVRKSKVGKLLLGSTAQYVILNAACPVVAVK